MTRKLWKIAPLVLGMAVMDKSRVSLLGPLGVNVEEAILAWLLISGKDKILVDTGLGMLKDSDIPKFFRQPPEQTLAHQLGRFELVPDDITLVINTHLHIDHCGGNIKFRNARCLVQRKELAYAQAPFPVHKPAYDMDLKRIRFEVLDGDTDIIPGITLLLMPGHSPGSQAVVVETEKGPHILAGDIISHFENMAVNDEESFLPGAFYLDLKEYYQSLDRLKNMEGVILPGHDPLVLKKRVYP